MTRTVRHPAVLFLLISLMGSAAVTHARQPKCERPLLRESIPVATPVAGDVLVATQNLWRLFDAVDDGVGDVVTEGEYQTRLDKLTHQIVEVLHVPDVLAVQEAENSRVLKALAAQVAARTGRPAYQVVLIEGADVGGIDVGFLVRADWKILAVNALRKEQRLNGKPLFDRPPLHLVVQTAQGRRLEMLNVHLKSLHGAETPAKAARIAEKRQQQTTALVAWWQQYRKAHPEVPLLMLGDFNAAPEVLGEVDVLGQLQSAGLVMLGERIPASERYSYVFQCRAELIDNLFASPALAPRVRQVAASRGNADGQRRMSKQAGSATRSSDHDALAAYLRL